MTPAISTGTTVIAIPSEKYLLITGGIYQVFETSDLPDGVVNIVTGRASEFLMTLAEHDDDAAIWWFTDEASSAAMKTLSVGNLKQEFTNEGRWFFDHTVQVKKHLGSLQRVIFSQRKPPMATKNENFATSLAEPGRDTSGTPSGSGF